MTDAPASFAVELEPPPTPRRRHRFVTAPSGLVLFVCLFLPAIRVCNEEPASAFEFWPLTTPYLLGLLVGVLALARRADIRRVLIAVIRGVLVFTVAGWAMFLIAQSAGEVGAILPTLAWCLVGVVLVAMFGRTSHDEAAAARVTLATGVLGIVWFGLWCLDPGALYGIYLAAAASLAMLVGGLEWRREIARDRTDSVVAPAARDVTRRRR